MAVMVVMPTMLHPSVVFALVPADMATVVTVLLLDDDHFARLGSAGSERRNRKAKRGQSGK